MEHSPSLQLEPCLDMGISAQEEDDLFIAGLLGGLEDSLDGLDVQMGIDDAIFEQALQVVDEGSKRFSPESFQFLQMVESVGQMLAARGCSHGHDFGKQMLQKYLGEQELDDGHDHKAEMSSKPGPKKKAKKGRQGAEGLSVKRSNLLWPPLGKTSLTLSQVLGIKSKQS